MDGNGEGSEAKLCKGLYDDAGGGHRSIKRE